VKILIVDDDTTNGILLRSFLEDYGECHLADNAPEAVEAMQHSLAAGKPYQLICLDSMMPRPR
jgi:two-component system, chemotaxis family, chemotaxis protein CheY